MLLAADSDPGMMFSLYATIPVWPLLGAIVAGLLIVARQPAERAALPVIGGVGLSAVLGVLLWLQGAFAAPWGHPGGHDDGGHAPAPHAAAPAETAAEHRPGNPDVQHGSPGSDAAGGHGGPAPKDYEHIGLTWPAEPPVWISLGAAELKAGRGLAFNFFFDGLTAMMLLFVTVVSTCVVVYAAGYMRDHHGHPERGYERFFAFLGLFVFSMAMLVLSGNFVMLYLGWELVGLCSYLLIGFYYSKPEAAAAAKKAFIVNRIGDFGFALGIFALYMFVSPLVTGAENALDYQTVFKYADVLATADSGFFGLSQATLVSLLLLCGALGKSAQFPLYTWLPDAMEGPTPVSALIHAATMVTAGIYMIARCGPLFAVSPLALDVVVVLGAIGAFLAATMAMAQYDMKRILAYSTISQLAYMFVGLGCLASDSAVFHVFTHAWFKALLFLCAGSVMHAMGGVIDLRHFSGLRSVLPKTQLLMLIGCLTLAGVPPLSGFWSKDEIVHAAFNRSGWLGLLMMVTAGMTAYYTFRMYFLCFHGPKRLPPEAGEHPHESPPVMIRPLWVLAGGAVALGVLLGVTPGFGNPFSTHLLGVIAPHGYFHHYLEGSTILTGGHHAGGIWIAYVSALIALFGIALAWVRYGDAPVADPDRQLLGPVFTAMYRKWWVDELYDVVFRRPLRLVSDLCAAIDRHGIDGLVWFISFVPRVLGGLLRTLHRGALQGYALSMVVGLALLLAIWFLGTKSAQAEAPPEGARAEVVEQVGSV